MIIGSLLCIHQITICTVPISYLRDTFCHVSCGNLCDIDNWSCLRTGEIQPIRKFGISSRVFLLEFSDQCWCPCQRVDGTLQVFFTDILTSWSATEGQCSTGSSCPVPSFEISQTGYIWDPLMIYTDYWTHMQSYHQCQLQFLKHLIYKWGNMIKNQSFAFCGFWNSRFINEEPWSKIVCILRFLKHLI